MLGTFLTVPLYGLVATLAAVGSSVVRSGMQVYVWSNSTLRGGLEASHALPST